MADLPRNDLEADHDAPFRLRRFHGRVPQLPCDSTDNKQLSIDDRIDSGVGCSLESQEFSALSIEGVRDFFATDSGKVCLKQMSSRCVSSSQNDNSTASLQNQLRNLSLGESEQSKDSVKSSRFDSGICDSGNFSVEEPFPVLEAAFPECGLTSSSITYESAFSQPELEELYSQDEDGDSYLHMSIIHLLPDVSLKVISVAPSPDYINIPNMLHQTPLHLAVATRQMWVVRRLMVAGASMEAPDYCGNTALHIACREGMTEMVKLLLTPVQYQESLANQYSLPRLNIPQDLAIRNYEGFTCAHLALQAGHLHILPLLLERGANINEQDGKSGRTLLHMAADLGYLQALELLLRQTGLDLNARTYGGLTAVLLAHGRRLNDVVELLHRAGADCSQLVDHSDDSTDEEMTESVYDDICINGQPVLVR